MRFSGFIFCMLSLTAAFAFASDGAPSSPLVTGFEPPAVVLADSAGPLGAAYFAVRANTPLDLTVEQIDRSGSTGFVPFNPAQTYQLSKSNALWLHFRVLPGKQGPTDWTVVLSKPFIDRAEFYFKDAQGVWRMQAAGTQVAHQRWPAQGLTPQFRLGEALDLAAPPGVALDKPRDFYIRIQKWIPLRFAIDIQRSEKVGAQTHDTFLTIGFLLGLLGFMFILSCVLSVLYRHTAYAWYAAYVVTALMAAASFSGIASYVIWPSAETWPALSTMVFVMLGLAAQLAFTRAIFIPPGTHKFWPHLLSGAAVLVLLASAVFVAVDQSRLRLTLFGLSVPMAFAIIAVVAVRALRYDKPVAALYLLSFAPMLAVIGLTQVEQLGIAALPWLPYNVPIYGLVLELPLLLIALHLHVKANHASSVRKLTLAELDPLTGFLAPLHFPDKLAHLWSEARHKGQDIAIAYVLRADIDANIRRHATPVSDSELGLRCVRMLRMVARPDDTIALIGANMFAVLMPGVSFGPGLSDKLARLVALGLMRDPDDRSGLPVKFRIAATSFGTFSGTSSQLDRALKQKLHELNVASQRSIGFIEN